MLMPELVAVLVVTCIFAASITVGRTVYFLSPDVLFLVFLLQILPPDLSLVNRLVKLDIIEYDKYIINRNELV